MPLALPRPSKLTLDNGLTVRAISWPAVPVVAVTLVIPKGSAADPPDRPGLLGLTADMLDEGAGSRDTIELAEEFARLGTYLEIDVSPDATSLGLTALSRHLAPLLDLVRDVVQAPMLGADALDRVRELRLSRLKQLRQTPAAPADRALLRAIFDRHPYGHGTLGTTASLQAITLDEVTALWRDHVVPAGATLVVVGDIEPAVTLDTARRAFEPWTATSTKGRELDGGNDRIPARRRVVFIDRPGAPQSEVRVGQVGPARRTSDYHALVTLNALLGGQFTSRINKNLRETRGITYGARTAFDFRRTAGTFEGEASVQGDATAVAVREMLREIDEVSVAGALSPAEVAQAKASLTRGYARGFETARQLARGAAHLAIHDLPDDTFDRFVPAVEALVAEDLTAAAQRALAPATCSIVVVGDTHHRDTLAEFGTVDVLEPEF